MRSLEQGAKDVPTPPPRVAPDGGFCSDYGLYDEFLWLVGSTDLLFGARLRNSEVSRPRSKKPEDAGTDKLTQGGGGVRTRSASVSLMVVSGPHHMISSISTLRRRQSAASLKRPVAVSSSRLELARACRAWLGERELPLGEEVPASEIRSSRASKKR